MGPEITTLLNYRNNLTWWQRRRVNFPIDLTELLRDPKATDFHIFLRVNQLSKTWPLLSPSQAKVFFEQPRVQVWQKLLDLMNFNFTANIFNIVAQRDITIPETLIVINILNEHKQCSEINLAKFLKPGAEKLLKSLVIHHGMGLLNLVEKNSDFTILALCLESFTRKNIFLAQNQLINLFKMSSTDLEGLYSILLRDSIFEKGNGNNSGNSKDPVRIQAANILNEKIDDVISCTNKRKLLSLVEDDGKDYYDAILATKHEKPDDVIAAIDKCRAADYQYTRKDTRGETIKINSLAYSNGLIEYKDPVDIADAIIDLQRCLPDCDRIDFKDEKNNNKHRLWVCLDKAIVSGKKPSEFIRGTLDIFALPLVSKDLPSFCRYFFKALKSCHAVKEYAQAVQGLSSALEKESIAGMHGLLFTQISTNDFFVQSNNPDRVSAIVKLCASGVAKKDGEFSYLLLAKFINALGESPSPLELADRICNEHKTNSQTKFTQERLDEIVNEFSRNDSSSLGR